MSRPMKWGTLLLFASGLSFLQACDSRVPRADLTQVRVDTIGDTIVVTNPSDGAWSENRTLVASTSIGTLDGPIEESFGRVTSVTADLDGRVYVLDSQARTVRVFDSDGSYIRSIGREGEGPGEFVAPSAVGVRADSYVLVRDPRRSQVHVFDPTGSVSDGWRLLSPTFATFLPLWTDQDLNSYIVVGAPPAPDAEVGDGIEVVMLRVAADGQVTDTIRDPGGDVRPPELLAEVSVNGGTSVYRAEVPFFPQNTYGILRSGDIVRSISDGSGVERVSRTGAIHHVLREHQPIPVTEGERRFNRQRVLDGMRRLAENWSWDGPDIPDTKPYVHRIYTAIDGQIWVQIHVEGAPVEDFDPASADASSGPTPWTEPIVFDVYRPDGTYLGMVRTPDEFQLSPAPVFDSTGVWAVTRDELGVQRVVRFTLAPENAL